MYRHDYHHHQQKEYRVRRMKLLAAWVCVAFSLLIVIGVVGFVLQTGMFGGQAKTPFPLLPHSIGAACTTPSHAPGDSTVKISSGQDRRSFYLHLPPSYGQQPLPLVFNYHGYDSTGEFQARYTNMGEEADQEHFIVVFPQGALDTADPAKPSWNAGIGAYGPTGTTDDVQFTSDMITYMEQNYCIDAHRIFVTGYSIGASMAYRVACSLSDQIAGLATVEAAFYHFDGGCHPKRAIPFLDIHGMADDNAPYDGYPARAYLSVPTLLDLWFSVDQCDANAKETIFQKDDVVGYKWSQCTTGAPVEQYIISDGGHVWAGSSMDRPDLGYTTHTIDANVVIWNFFKPFHT